MLALETVVKIRNDHFRDKVPIKAIARKRRVSRNTVRKAVRERPTLTRTHDDLAALGRKAGYDSVRWHAAAWRERQAAEAPREAHVPLAFDPGEAFQFNWSVETMAVGGSPVKAGWRTSAFATAGWRSCGPAAGRAWRC